MASSSNVSEFLEWVLLNYGEEVKVELEKEVSEPYHGNMDELFSMLYRVLARYESKRMNTVVEFGEIRYNSY
ncbi:MAG: hypothetical protein ACYSXD_08340 [Planctomycetota bacterium]|jgi:hypothetical protein